MKKVQSYQLEKLLKKLKPYIIEMDKKIKQFDETEIEKYKFYQHKSPFLIDNIDFNTIVVSNEITFGKEDFNFFIDYKDAKKIKPLCILSAYRRDFDKIL